MPPFSPSLASQREEPTEDLIAGCGLRYVAKVNGTPFPNGASAHRGALLSCFFCGTHQPATRRRHQRVLGRSTAVCEPPCDKNPRSKTTKKRTDPEAAQ